MVSTSDVKHKAHFDLSGPNEWNSTFCQYEDIYSTFQFFYMINV